MLAGAHLQEFLATPSSKLLRRTHGGFLEEREGVQKVGYVVESCTGCSDGRTNRTERIFGSCAAATTSYEADRRRTVARIRFETDGRANVRRSRLRHVTIRGTSVRDADFAP